MFAQRVTKKTSYFFTLCLCLLCESDYCIIFFYQIFLYNMINSDSIDQAKALQIDIKIKVLSYFFKSNKAYLGAHVTILLKNHLFL